jgi:hypothetical protein
VNRRRLAALVLALAASGLGGCGKSVGEGSDRLLLKGPRWWFSRLPVVIEATPSGVLAGRDTTLTLFVGANAAGRREMKKRATRIWIPGGYFSTGANQVTVKTGSERSELRVQVVSVLWLVALVTISGALAAALVSQWRKRRVARVE